MELLEAGEPAIRYWGATGLAIHTPEKSRKRAVNALIKLSKDPVGDVAVSAAEALYKLGETNTARAVLLNMLESGNRMVRVHALNVIDCVNESESETRKAVIEMVRQGGKISRENMDQRAAKWLLEKWRIDEKSVGLDVAWKW